jgi:hypothetical protein
MQAADHQILVIARITDDRGERSLLPRQVLKESAVLDP